MKQGIWIGTGIAIGLVLNAVTFLVVRPASAGPQSTETKQADSSNGPMIMGTGGSQSNKNDIVWVLFRDGKEVGTVKKKAGDEKIEVDRYVLAAYQVKEGGKEIDIVDLRNVSWDVKRGELEGKTKCAPQQMFADWVKTKP